MGKRRPKKRNYKMINFKAYYDNDADILDWWENLEDGERSETLRDVIRGHLGLPSKARRTRTTAGTIIELPELMEMRRDTLWIKDALNDMPAYLERVIQHVAANAQVSVGHPARASPEVVANNEPALTDAETQRRTRKMRRATW